MRTLSLVITLLLVNDVALVAFLDVSVPTSAVVVVAAVALSVSVLAVVSVAVDSGGEPPTRTALQAEVDSLRRRVEELEE